MKRRQRASGSREHVPKWAVVEADTVTHAVEGNIVAGKSRAASPNGPTERDDSTGAGETRHVARVSQEPGKPAVSTEGSGTESEGNGATGTSGEVTEHPVVPMKSGNRLKGPDGGKGMPDGRNRRRER